MKGDARAAPQVSVILVNWNGLEDTSECLDSLALVTYPNFSIVVVDNGSRRDEAQALRQSYPRVTVLTTERNLGFTGGNNIGIKYALTHGAEYILCLNNDTVVAPDFLGLLVQALEDQPNAGIATAAIYYHDQPDRLSALGCWVDLSQAAPVGHIDDTTGHDVDLTDITEVAAVDGCVLMMRRTVAEATGGFDDRFFAYVEDADLCLRARRAGWRCLAVPASHVWHKIGSTTGGEFSPTATHYYMRNSCRLVRRHGNRQERAQVYHAFLELWSAEWEAFWLDGEADGSVWRDPRRLKDLQERAVNVCISILRCHGPRKNYLALEKTVQLFVLLRIKVTVAAADRLLSAYTRIYWKLYSISPLLVLLMPKPFLSLLRDRQKRRWEKRSIIQGGTQTCPATESGDVVQQC